MARSLSLVLLAAVLAATGCGTSGRERRAQFVAKAGEICRHFDGLQNEVPFPSTNPVAPGTSHAARAEWGVALKQVAYLGTQEVKALRKLSAPGELRERYAVLLAAKGEGFDALLAGADAARRNRPQALKERVATGRAALARAGSVAKALGLPRCA